MDKDLCKESQNGNFKNEILNDKHNKSSERKLDKVIILTTVTLCSVLIGMNWIAFPILYVEFSEYFGESKWLIGGVGSLQNALAQLLGLVISAPVQVYGCKPVAICGGVVMCIGFVASAFASNVAFLYVTFGVTGGIGWSLANLPCHVIVQQHFDKHRSIATTISMMGRSVGNLVGPLVLEYLITKFTWRGALVVYGGLMLNISALAITFYTPKSLKTTEKKGIKAILKALVDFSIFKEVTFTMFCISIFLLKFNVNGFYHHLPSRMVYYGTSKLAAAWLLTAAAFCSIVFRLAAGIIGNMKCADRTIMYTVSLLIGGFVTVALPLFDIYVVTAIFAGIFGGCRGSALLVLNIALVDLFGVDKFARSKALLNTFQGIAGLIATPFSGWIFDVTQNYNIPFYVSGCLGLLGGIIALFAVIINKRKPRNTSNTNDITVSIELKK